MKKTAALLIGFGGPRRIEEVKPFLESVLRGVQIPQERFDEVMLHYEIIGGVSPYNEITELQRAALCDWLKSRGTDLPVFIGYRHSFPSFEDTFRELKEKGYQRIIGFVLSSFRTYASFEKYKERLEEGRAAAGAEIEVLYTKPFYNDLHFIDAQSKRVEELLEDWNPAEEPETFFLFTAHSVPETMSTESSYDAQFAEAASLVARRLDLKFWDICYQSRSGRPQDPWLGPDVKERIQKINQDRFKNLVLVPIGFLCDNVEVLYDLDVEAKRQAEQLGFKFARAKTVMDHPKFIAMIGERILERIVESGEALS